MNSKSTLKIVITIILITSTYQFAFGQEDISFEITEFGTLDSHQGYYREMSINDEHHETDFLFEESGYVRWYAYKMSWQDEFQILPEGTYLVKSENMQIGDEWNSWWDGEAVATVHDTSTIAIGEGLLAFTYKVEYRGPDWELKTVIWWCNDIGWVKFAVNDRKTITDWTIEGGTGYHPLFVGNRWEFMDQSELNTVTTSIDSTTFIFNHTCFVANMKDNGIWSRTFYWEVQNDTVYTRGNLNRGEPLRQENYVFSPLFPTIGSHWWSRWPSGGLNRFYVSDTLTVESPAGSFLSYKCDVTDSITVENIGTWFMAENVGMLKVDQVFEGDTFVLILQSYNIEGGDGVLPLEVGNQWRMVWEGYTGVDGFSGVDRPTEITLNQNYPNPFNAQTTISFNLTDPGPVKLEIYNLLGQKVETLIDEFYRRGPHTVNWDAVSQSSSTYFYKLTTGSEKSTRQMTLLK